MSVGRAMEYVWHVCGWDNGVGVACVGRASGHMCVNNGE